jgi:hypothetical protein
LSQLISQVAFCLAERFSTCHRRQLKRERRPAVPMEKLAVRRLAARRPLAAGVRRVPLPEEQKWQQQVLVTQLELVAALDLPVARVS